MRPPSKHGRLRLWPAASVLGGAVLLAAAALLASRDPGSTARLELPARTAEPLQQTSRRVSSPAAKVVKAATPARDVQKPRPVKILIPAIGVSAPVIPLGLNPDRTLEVPKDYGDTGWFTRGPEPGEPGAAVITGHVDSKRGPAVFYRLRQLRRGDLITIVLKDRTTVRYVVRSSKAVPKNRFPTKLVYRKTPYPALRLITCDGAFDTSTGHYRDNYIVFATLAERR